MTRATRPTSHARSVAAFALVVGGVLPAIASAAPRLRCRLDQGGESQVVEVAPVRDPYRVRSVDVRGHFRFKAVVVGDEQHVEYVKLYTYYTAERQPALLHEVRFDAPVAEAAPGPAALTGVHRVYSPILEREFRFGCALFEVAP